MLVDASEKVIHYCVCSPQLVPLREEDLKNHPTDTLLMTHFHLPPEAPHIVKDEDIDQLRMRLCDLHEAYRRLRKAEEISALESNMEREFKRIENELRVAREKVKAMKEAYEAEVLQAISETKSKSIYQWNFEPGSLSSIIWNFEGRKSKQLKVLDINFESLFALQLSIKSCIQSLSDLRIGPEQSELGELRKEVESLRKENAELRQELEAARSPLVQPTTPSIAQVAGKLELRERSKGPFKVLAVHNRPGGLNEVPRVFGTENIKPTKLEDAVLDQVAAQGKETIIEKSLIEDAMPLFEKKAQQKCKELEPGEAGNITGSMDWTERLGVHLGKLAEAEELVNTATSEQSELGQASKEALLAMGTKAALHFHRGQMKKCMNVCKFVIAHFDPNYPELYLKAAYFYTAIADYDENEAAEQENCIQSWVSMVPDSSNLATMALKACIQGKIAFNQKDFQKAETCLQEAQNLLEQQCVRSSLSAINSFFLARTSHEQENYEKALKFYQVAETFFVANLSKSLWHGMNLNWTGEAYSSLNNNKKAIETKKAANEIFEKHFSSKIDYADNLKELAELHEDKKEKEKEINYREKARVAYSKYHPTDIKGIKNLTKLGELYGQQKCTFKEAKDRFLEAKEAFARQCPTSIKAGLNLLYLAQLCDKFEYEVEARDYANEAKKVLTSLDTKKAKEALEKAEKVLSHERPTKKRKREA